MKIPKAFTKVTPFSKILALSLFILLPILAFYYGIYYEQQNHTELPNPFCTQWKTVCDPSFTDSNGGCAPKKICVDKETSTLKQACQKKEGTWLEEYKECESSESDKGMDQASCTALGGEFNGCNSTCRHNNPQGACTALFCVKTCQFQ